MTAMLTVTPTVNSIPIRHGDFPTATDALAYAAQGEAGFNFFNAAGQLTAVLDYRRLWRESMRAGLYLKQQGFARYDRVALIAETTPDFPILFFACQYAGLIPCPMAFSLNPGGMAAYAEKLSLWLDNADAKAVMCSKNVADALGQHIAKPLLVSERMLAEATLLHQPEASELSPLGAGDPAYVQFSSGSTSRPKGVLLSQRHLEANIHAVLRYGMQLRPEDRSFNWLPFHHNMGLVGFMLASVYGQRSVDCLSAEHFVQNPLVWLELMSKHRTAITFSPAFGYQLAMKKYAESESKPSLDLSSLRVAGIGGDAISAEVLSTFSASFAPSGFKTQAFLPCYGLTETTLAVTASDLDAPTAIDSPDDDRSKTLVSCGRALPGFEIKITDAEGGKRLPERQVGQIWVKGPSVVTSYIDDRERITFDGEGFMYTGDLGYLSQRLLYISGREKDVIIVRGRNVWAQDVEWAVLQAQPNIGAGNAAAIGLHDGLQERLATLVCVSPEVAQDKAALRRIALAIKKALAQATGVTAEVIFIADRLPLTASGKLARAQAKEAYLANQFMIIHYDEETL
ncbi:acyl-CoA synthetase [Leminorella grimontii]|uniref:Acyl-CoA synthetase n=1 Tax=Leminorella grimontii TaxID=82981 RepID=A0AAV5MVN0_9GAMM|nr:AMP-binding protein [Leminorella grimontii]KFC95535.1 long-chain-fatty-acid--CoA ligase [Leminorella grimontii ATCC 33999 = DSM 5078]GKX53891.1 acyl-CoA synthetase [Leminorella grimontii]